MATKKKLTKKEPKKVLFTITEAEREEVQLNAIKEVEKFKTDLSHKVSFGILSKLEAKSEIDRHIAVVRKQQEKYELKIENWRKKISPEISPNDILEFTYWQTYLHNLNRLTAKSIKVESPTKSKELSEFFTGKMPFANFQNILERARITSKGKMKKDGVAYKLLATFDVLEDRGILQPKEKVAFRDAFTEYYTGSPLSKSAYSNAKNNDKGDIEAYKAALINALK